MTITARVIADSIANNIRLTTLELCYPRFIHSQFMTHRMFSRNASSSRAIPVSKIIKEIEDNPAMPVHWGKNQPGMQADEELCEAAKGLCEQIWRWAAEDACTASNTLNRKAVHKQIVNRVLEPFSHIKVIVTATEWGNFFKLRLDHDSQPEIQELARVMKETMDASSPKELQHGEWHLPYVETRRYLDGILHYGCIRYDNPHDNTPWFDEYNLDQAIKASIARCARVSYNNHDNSSPNIRKDIELADKLIASGHMSPLEHQLTPMLSNQFDGDFDNLEKGVTHVDRNKFKWSGNARGWVMYRQLI